MLSFALYTTNITERNHRGIAGSKKPFTTYIQHAKLRSICNGARGKHFVKVKYEYSFPVPSTLFTSLLRCTPDFSLFRTYTDQWKSPRYLQTVKEHAYCPKHAIYE